jgi:hypothetical protein
MPKSRPSIAGGRLRNNEQSRRSAYAINVALDIGDQATAEAFAVTNRFNRGRDQPLSVVVSGGIST